MGELSDVSVERPGFISNKGGGRFFFPCLRCAKTVEIMGHYYRGSKEGLTLKGITGWKKLFCSKKCHEDFLWDKKNPELKAINRSGFVFYKNCEYCGKRYCRSGAYNPNNSALIPNRSFWKKFCSRLCYERWIDRQARDGAIEIPTTNGIAVHFLCEHCGKRSKRSKHTLNPDGHFFCSRKCRYEAIGNPKLRKIAQFTCKECGKVVRVASLYTAARRLFCSKRCYFKEKLRITKGARRNGLSYVYFIDLRVIDRLFLGTCRSIDFWEANSVIKIGYTVNLRNRYRWYRDRNEFAGLQVPRLLGAWVFPEKLAPIGERYMHHLFQDTKCSSRFGTECFSVGEHELESLRELVPKDGYVFTHSEVAEFNRQMKGV